MSSSTTHRVLAICDEVLAASASDRDAVIHEACGDDQSLRQQVLAVIGAMTSADDALLDGAFGTDANFENKMLGAYRLTQPLGEGGMGSVWLAERQHEDFKQTVAVKVIRGRFLGNDLIRRFNAEREILASLNHPYIAQMIDGGTEQGVPFLVMEYVDGQSVNQYLDATKADLRTRLKMLQKIALAVHAAHQNLVVHRDLKPSNVLVTEDGIPKLLDFGIAKLIDADAGVDTDATQLGRQALTPDYASPEQIQGSPVTTLSDVYSLGILAYELLAGERPYRLEASAGATLATAITDLHVPKASQRLSRVKDSSLRDKLAAARNTTPDNLARMLRGDLDNILGKALAINPSDRYASVAAFSTDIDRYLANEPVDARADSFAYRANRFVARNRGVVVFSAALLLSLLVGLAATTWSYLRAEAARTDAMARYDQVRSLAKTMMFDVYDDVAKIPGTTSVRADLAATAQEYLATLVSGQDAPVEVQLEAAQGYSRLYTILNREAVDDVDDRARAIEAWDKAIGILNNVTLASPQSSEAWQALGELYSNRASDKLTLDNDPEAAREMLAAAKSPLVNAQQLSPSSLAVTIAQQVANQHAINIEKWSDEYEAAVVLAKASLEALQGALETWPDSVRLHVIAGDTYQLKGESHYWIDQYPETLESYEASIAAYNKALELGGRDQSVESQLADALWSRGNTYIDMQRPAEAAPDYAAAMALISMAVARDPDDKASARRFVILRASQAMALVNSGEGDRAISLMIETNDWFEEQALLDPDTPGPQRSLAISYYMMGDIYRLAERSTKSCEWFSRSLQKWLQLDEQYGLAEFDAGQPDKIRENISECS